MTQLILYDDERARSFEPFATTRPACELRAGAMLVRERWESVAGVSRADGFVSGSHLEEFEESGAPGAWTRELPAGAIVANARCLPAAGARAGDADAWVCGGRIAAARLRQSVPVDRLRDGTAELSVLAGGSRVDIPGRWIEEVWDLVSTLPQQLAEDIASIGPGLDCVTPAESTVIGGNGIYVERGARVEPLTVLDASNGPILVRAGAEIRAFTRLIGPCFVAAGSVILGDRVHACAIGERSLIRGEISETTVVGYCNKAHDGFVGHSYLGRWVNLGAGTITSNLKNTYGTVGLWTPSGIRNTGMVKLGSFLGDHVKTGIGLRLTTGSVIGAGSNVYGAAMPPRYVPPFSWGEGEELSSYQLEKFLETASRAMSRRQVELGARGRRQLSAAHALRRRGNSDR